MIKIAIGLFILVMVALSFYFLYSFFIPCESENQTVINQTSKMNETTKVCTGWICFNDNGTEMCFQIIGTHKELIDFCERHNCTRGGGTCYIPNQSSSGLK